ncbi:hypothetical protein KMW40_14500 [Enterobacter cloacae]|uniref:hypothetical protein n=1 Tax=Enterobacter cloacae TaxID=550 RepID=UPI0034A31E39
MSIFKKRKINENDSLQQAINKKSENSTISQKTIIKLNQKLNNLKTISEVNDAKRLVTSFTDRNIRQQVMDIITSNQNVRKIVNIDNTRSITYINQPLTLHKATITNSAEINFVIEHQWYEAVIINPYLPLTLKESPERKIILSEKKEDTMQENVSNYLENIGKKSKGHRVTFAEKTKVAQIPTEDEAKLLLQNEEDLHNDFQPYNIKLTEEDIRIYLNIVRKMMIRKFSPTQIQNEIVHYMKHLPSFSGLNHNRKMYQFLAEEKSEKLFNNILHSGLLYCDPRTISAELIKRINPDNPARKQTRR